VKVQIVYLDPEDDQASAREKLRWARAARVVLVWPGRGRVLVRMLDLRLLQRQAARQGAQLGLVSHDPDVLRHAADLGIPVFESVDALESGRWHMRGRVPALDALRAGAQEYSPEERPGRPSSASRRPLPPWARAATFGTATLLLLAALLALLPTATLVISPETENRSMSLAIRLAVEDSRELPAGTLPVRVITRTVNGDLRLPTTGTSSQPQDPARGSVRLTNISSESIVLLSGTRLIPLDSAGPAFESGSGAVIAPQASVDVPVRALEPGPAGNLPAGTTWAIEGSAGLALEATNPAPMSGGSLAARGTVTAGDLQQLQTQLEAQLLDEAVEAIRQTLESGDRLINESTTTMKAAPAEFDHQPGDVADSLGLSVTLEVQVLAYQQAVLEQVLAEALARTLSVGWQILPLSLTVQSLEYRSDGNGQAGFLQAAYDARTFTRPEAAGITRAVRLQPVQRVEALLEQALGTSELLSASVKPRWLPLFPPFDFQYSILLPWEVET